MAYRLYSPYFFFRRAGLAIWVGVYCKNCGRVRTRTGLPPAVGAAENSGEKGLGAGIVSVVATEGVSLVSTGAVFMDAPEVGVISLTVDGLEADGAVCICRGVGFDLSNVATVSPYE